MSRQLTGTVVSAKPDQTIVVAVSRRVNHPVYRKAYTVTKKVYAHDPENTAKAGDTVTVQEIPPKSRLKRWQLITGEAKPAATPAAKAGAKAAPKTTKTTKPAQEKSA